MKNNNGKLRTDRNRNDDLAALPAWRLAKLFRAKALSPVEALEAVLARQAATADRLNAFFLVMAEEARQAARAAEKRYARGAPLSALDGCPASVKENLASKGDPTPVGVPIADMTPAAADSPVVARLREAGCVIFGKTTMPDYGMLSAGLSSLHGVTRNPWDLSTNPAGSSSGAGAAAAAGIGALHVGTDIGGSIRLPAAHCGVFGLKPSHGRAPTYPTYLGRVAGPMTRDVRDSALMMNVIARPDARDYLSIPSEKVDYASGLDTLALKGLRIGILVDAGAGLPSAPAGVQAVTAAAMALAREGARVDRMDPFLTEEMLDAVCRFFEARSYSDIIALDARDREKLLPYIVEWCTWRAKDFSGLDVMRAYGGVMAMAKAAADAHAPYDFVLAPVAPVLRYPAEHHSPTNDPRRALAHIPFTVPYNMSEHPAASVPWTHDADGTPIGVQVIGARFDDRGVLRLSRALERLRPPLLPYPALD